MNGGESTVKLGDVLLNFQIKEDFSHLNISELCESLRNSTNESFQSLLRKELEGLSPLKSLKSFKNN